MAIVVGAVVTASIVVVSLIVVMFSTGPDDGRRTGLFGAVFFEATTDATGTTTATGGIADGWPILTLLLIATAACMLVAVVYGALRDRQRMLRERVQHEQGA